jgi:exopolysaccharide biosynthesis polyprenyl glycosylphosphotransferase
MVEPIRPDPSRAELEFAPPRRLLVGAPRRRGMLVKGLKILDLVTMSSAFLAAAVLSSLRNVGFSVDEFLSLRLRVVNFLLFMGLLLLWHASFRLFRLYEPGLSLVASRSLLDVLKATTLGTCLVAGSGAAFQIGIITPLFVLLLWLLGSAALTATRLMAHSGLRLLARSGETRRNILIVGTGPRAIRFAHEVERSPEAGGRLIGFVDASERRATGTLQLAHPLVSGLSDFPSFLRENIVDEVVIAVDARFLQSLKADLLDCCEENGVPVRFLSSILADLERNTDKDEVSPDEIVMTVYNGTADGWPLVAKRSLDILVSATGLILLSPLLALIALLVKLSSPGPVFFGQERFGLNKRRFRFLKFRTMVEDAEKQLVAVEHLNESGGPTFKMRHDPRVTPLGRFLRTTSTDALPQLINVLRGEMSLVGPRPLPTRDVEGFAHDFYRRRFSVRPGMTGLWQVSGRSSIPFEKWMRLDLRYIDEWSLTLDLKILARTVPAVLSRKGAL